MSKILEPLLNIFRFHKKKVLAFFGFFLLFVYLLFPFNDLGDLVSTKISEATAGQVFVDFESIDLSLFPKPGLSFSKVTVDTPFLPALSTKSLSVSPSILSLLSFRRAANVHASGFFGGDLDLTAGDGDKTTGPSPHKKVRVSLDLSDMNLSGLAKLASLPMKIDGTITGSIDSQVDPQFTEQPQGDIDIKLAKTVIPEGNINTPLGAIGIPKLNMGEIVLQARGQKGQFEISKFVVGKKGGDLFATLTGRVDTKIQKFGSSVNPDFGYDLMVNLQIGDTLRQKLGPFLSVLQNFQSAPNTYAFRMTAPDHYSPPQMTKIQ